jgi:hypothetical protein
MSWRALLGPPLSLTTTSTGMPRAFLVHSGLLPAIFTYPPFRRRPSATWCAIGCVALLQGGTWWVDVAVASVSRPLWCKTTAVLQALIAKCGCVHVLI